MDHSSMGENGQPGRRRLSGRCVVLTPRDRDAPAALITALTNKGVRVDCAHEEPAVMGLLAQTGVTLVVVAAPEHWQHLDALCEAMREHYPRVLYWQYAEGVGGKTPRLSKLEPATPSTNTTASTKYATSMPNGAQGPIGRIVGRRRVTERLAVKAPQESQAGSHAVTPTTPLVSEEELSMLLGPTPNPTKATGEAG